MPVFFWNLSHVDVTIHKGKETTLLLRKEYFVKSTLQEDTLDKK